MFFTCYRRILLVQLMSEFLKLKQTIFIVLFLYFKKREMEIQMDYNIILNFLFGVKLFRNLLFRTSFCWKNCIYRVSLETTIAF